MKPSLVDINHLLDSYLVNPVNQGWIVHGRSVGDSAGKIATAINQHSRAQLDVEKVTALGYLHDIGKSDGNFNFLGHLLKGYVMLKQRGYPDDFCHICLTHSFISNDPNLTLTGNLFAPSELPSPEFIQSLRDALPSGDVITFLTDFLRHHTFTLEEKIISLCDLMCLYSPLTLEARIVDIISRHGTGDHTQAFILAAFDLKRELESLTGADPALIIGAKQK